MKLEMQQLQTKGAQLDPLPPGGTSPAASGGHFFCKSCHQIGGSEFPPNTQPRSNLHTASKNFPRKNCTERVNAHKIRCSRNKRHLTSHGVFCHHPGEAFSGVLSLVMGSGP